MRLTKEHKELAYIPKEIKETFILETTYQPVDKALLKKYFPNMFHYEKKSNLKKKRRQ